MKDVNKSEYESILLHGADKIMKAKLEFIQQEEINIDKLIHEGIKNHHMLKEESEKEAKIVEVQAENFKGNENALDLTLETMKVREF